MPEGSLRVNKNLLEYGVPTSSAVSYILCDQLGVLNKTESLLVQKCQTLVNLGMTVGLVVNGLYHKWSFSLGKEKNENFDVGRI